MTVSIFTEENYTSIKLNLLNWQSFSWIHQTNHGINDTLRN